MTNNNIEFTDLQLKSSELDKKTNLFKKLSNSIIHKKDLHAFVNKAICTNKAKTRLLDFKKKTKYKIYSIIPYTLVIFIILFICLLIGRLYNTNSDIDNMYDKLIDLCNGIVVSILMIYIGTVSFRFYQLKKDAENDKTCEITTNS